MFRHAFKLFALAALTFMHPHSAVGDVQYFLDQDEWEAVVGAYDTIDFTGFPAATIITDQYADQGVVFSGFNLIFGPTLGFPNDGWGLHGVDGIHIHFDSPMNWLAVQVGFFQADFYLEGELVAASPLLNSGFGGFLGLVPDVSFDEVYLFRIWPDDNNILIDDLHFGAIPAPGALALLGLAVLGARRRRE